MRPLGFCIPVPHCIFCPCSPPCPPFTSCTSEPCCSGSLPQPSRMSNLRRVTVADRAVHMVAAAVALHPNGPSLYTEHDAATQALAEHLRSIFGLACSFSGMKYVILSVTVNRHAFLFLACNTWHVTYYHTPFLAWPAASAAWSVPVSATVHQHAFF